MIYLWSEEAEKLIHPLWFSFPRFSFAFHLPKGCKKKQKSALVLPLAVNFLAGFGKGDGLNKRPEIHRSLVLVSSR